MLRPLDLHVAGTASSTARAIELVDEVRPDLLIVGMRAETATEAAALIRTVRPRVRSAIIALGDKHEPGLISSALAAGAVAFLQKPQRR
jgi:AmiR/NasT family two-component response regulator